MFWREAPENFGNFRKSNILKWGCRHFRKNKGYFPEIRIFDDQTTSKMSFMHFYKHPVGKRKIKKSVIIIFQRF